MLKGAVLDNFTIRQMVMGETPLVECIPSLETQLQANGIDLTLRAISLLTSPGRIGHGPESRKLSELELLEFDSAGWRHIPPGGYLVTFNEVINLPLNLMALGRPRSSLLRSGVSIHSAVWDAGYSGRSQSLLVIHNPNGYELQEGAGLMQLVFFQLVNPVNRGYSGFYQGENV